jgi:flagellar secretion chaperone FliS
MNPYAKYIQQPSPCWTRIDMLLALFDGAVERCEQVVAALERQDGEAAQPLLNKARLIVCGLVSGVVADGDPVTTNILRLYEYVLHSLGQGGIEEVRGALTVLRTLREGFQEARPEAVALERNGVIPPIDSLSTVRALA